MAPYSDGGGDWSVTVECEEDSSWAEGVAGLTTGTPTSQPTAEYTAERSATMVFTADFSELEDYAASSGKSTNEVAVEIVETAMGLDDSSDVVVTVTDVREGSVIIDYTIQSNDADALSAAIETAEDSIGDTLVIGDLELTLDSNTVESTTTTTESVDSEEPGGNTASSMSAFVALVVASVAICI